jgi:hypothetical protein
MSVVEKAEAIMGSLTPTDLAALPPAQRRRFADLCRHLADLAEPHPDREPKAGVLADLKNGLRDD